MNLPEQIEAFLFFRGEPISLRELSEYFAVNEEEVERAVTKLQQSLHGRGIRLVQNASSVSLRTAPEASALLEKIEKEEREKDLGKASLETLAVIVYFGPISKPEIEYIRGVNSSFIIRNLLIRGLIERLENRAGRGFLYQGTIDLAGHLGLEHFSHLPEFEEAKRDFEMRKHSLEERKKEEITDAP